MGNQIVERWSSTKRGLYNPNSESTREGIRYGSCDKRLHQSLKSSRARDVVKHTVDIPIPSTIIEVPFSLLVQRAYSATGYGRRVGANKFLEYL
jgi:hypothetical protein